MNWAPLLNATPLIKVHLSAAVAAFVLGVAQFLGRKGTFPHRSIGWAWLVLMVVMILTGFALSGRGIWGPFSTHLCLVPSRSESWLLRCSALHVSSLYALLLLPYAALHARRGNLQMHRWTLVAVFLGAVVVAGSFTFQPPRILNAIFFGSANSDAVRHDVVPQKLSSGRPGETMADF